VAPLDLEALIFDSDGVLVDSEAIHIAVEKELLAELGLEYNHSEYLSRFVGLSNADFYSELASDFSERVGGAFPTDFASKLQERVWPRIEGELRAIEGVERLVDAFCGGVAVGSSAPIGRLMRKLEITNLDFLFRPHIYSVDHVQNGKPAPDLFLHAARQLGVQPERCAVIEDSVNGVLAARAANMVPIGFVGGGHADARLGDRLRANGAAFVVSSHSEIVDLVRTSAL
jgi:beta-phosphoglucomutase-like phosphatase (HAD superfamily)